MGKNKTGRRYSEQEKYEILNYLQNHTYKDTSAFFNISEQTLARWKRSLSLSVSDQNAKIVLGIPSYWLDYLNDKIAQNVWENYDDAILNIIKSYDRTQKSLGSVQDDNEFISQLSVILEELIENNPEIDAILARNRISIEFQSKLWPSSEVNPLLKGWNRFLTHEKESVVNFAGMKYIITYGIPEQIVYAKSHKNSTGMKKIANDYICGVRKEFSRNTWYFFALVNTEEKLNPMGALANLHRVVHNIEPISEKDVSEHFDKRIYEIEKDYSNPNNKKSVSSGPQEPHKPLEYLIHKKHHPPIDSVEKLILKTLEKKIGEKISRFSLIPDKNNEIIDKPSEKWDHESAPIMCYMYGGHVVHLKVRGINLTELPSDIKEFSFLNTLDLRGNQIKRLPESLGALKWLEELYLGRNQLRMLPGTLSDLRELVKVDLSYNEFEVIPPPIFELTNLRELNLANNQISSLPSKITHLERLRFIDLTGNNIESVDSSFKNNLHTYIAIKL